MISNETTNTSKGHGAMTRVLLLATDPELTERMEGLPGLRAACLDGDQIAEIVRLGGLKGIVGPDPDHMPDIVVLGDGCPLADSLSIAESLEALHVGIRFVLIAEPDTDLVMRAMRVGIRDIVPASISQDEIKVLIHNLASRASRPGSRRGEERPEPDNSNRVIVVTAPKGGVGKSTIATNLAAALAKEAPMETVLVDLDLQFGNVATLMNLQPLHTIDDAFESTAALDTLILKTFLTVHHSGFYVLCGAISPTLRDGITADQVKHLLQQLSSQFANIVVDTSSGVDAITLGAIETATDLVFVSSMESTSTGALRKQMRLLDELDAMPASRHIVLNFADRHSGVDVRQVEASIGAPVEIVVPRTFDVPVAANLGHTLVDTHSRGVVPKAIRNLVARIREDVGLELASKHRGIEVA